MPLHPFVFALLAIWPCVASADPASDKREILVVVDAFRNAIVDKDRQAFLDLFLHEGVTWQSVMSEEDFRLEKARNRHATRATHQPDRSPAQFIQGIVDNPVAIEETFENALIDTDGAAASVAFDFEFLRNGKAVNLGREYWLLVRTDAGWKIASVVWSNNRADAPEGRKQDNSRAIAPSQ